MKNKKTANLSKFKKEELFYHDLLNHVHNIGLFFDLHKKYFNLGDEFLHVKKELKLMRSMISKQCSRTNQASFSCSIGDLIDKLQHLSQLYLNNTEVKWKINLNFSDRERFVEDWVLIERVLNNLFKNIAESEANYCRIEIYMINSKVTVFFVNNFLTTEKKNDSRNLGLKSIKHCLDKIDGKYECYSRDRVWYGHLTIPSSPKKTTYRLSV